MVDFEHKYMRCRNCGRYIEKNQSVGELYCSEQCAQLFTRCKNCGNFFQIKKNNRQSVFCSLECKAEYSEDGIFQSSKTVVSPIETEEDLSKD